MERPAIITTRRAAHAALGCAAILLFACDSTTGPAPVIQQKAVILEAVTSVSIDGAVGTNATPTPVVRLRYEDGTLAPGVEVSFTATGSVVTLAPGSAVTDSDGRASPGAWGLGTTMGTQTLTARARGGSLMFTAHVRAGPAAALTVTGGNQQSAAAGATLAEPLRVRALDRFDNPVAGAAVTFIVVDGGGAIAADTAFTDGLGNATSQLWTLGPVAGEQRVRAQSGNLRFVFSAAACEPRSCSRLAYVNDGAIFTLDGNTGLVHRLTSSDHNDQPAWSPDGTRIAFTRYGNDGLSADVWVMNADGSEPTRITTASGFSSPSWSPGGDALVFSGVGCVYYCDIYLQSLAEEGAPRRLAMGAADPAWSPDGSRIAFVALSGDDGYQSLRLVEPDGSGIVEVTPIDAGVIDGPSWSPDGTLIAFSKCMSGACDIHTVRPDGSDLTRLTDVGNASSPAWSADGTRIAFTVWSAGVPSIALISAAGGAVTTLIASAHSPAWRP